MRRNKMEEVLLMHALFCLLSDYIGLLDNQSILFMVYMRDTDNATLIYFIPQAGAI